MAENERSHHGVERKSSVLSRRTDSVVRELLETENMMSYQALSALRSQYRKDRDSWLKMYEEQKGIANNLNVKLAETEAIIRSLQNEYTEAQVVEMEKMRITGEELVKNKKAESEKWSMIEEQIKVFNQVVKETQERLVQEEQALAAVRENFSKREKGLANTIEEQEFDLLKIRQELSSSKEAWVKDRARYEEENRKLKQENELLKAGITEEKKTSTKVHEKKDDELSKLRILVQEMVIKLTEERKITSDLKQELANKEDKIQESGRVNRNITERIEKEKAQWNEILKAERSDIEKYKGEISDREGLFKKRTEEQLDNVMNMLSTLEAQLRAEHENRMGLEDQVKGLISERKLMEEEHALYRKNRQAEIAELVGQINSMKAGLEEEKKIYLMERDEKMRLKASLSDSEKEIMALNSKLSVIKDEYEGKMAQEQDHYSNRIEELNAQTGLLRKTREQEIRGIEGEKASLEGELAEMRAIYFAKKVENEQYRARIQELEVALGRQIDMSEKERSEWENVLGSEQMQWEQKRAQLVERESKLIEDRESEIKRLQGALDDTMAKLIDSEQSVQDLAKKHFTDVKTIENVQRQNLELKDMHDNETRNFQAEMGVLRASVEKLQNERFTDKKIADNRAFEIKTLYNKISGLDEQVGYHSKLVTEKENEIAMLRQKINALQQKIKINGNGNGQPNLF